MGGVGRLVRSRWELLGLLRHLGGPVTLLLGAVMLVAAVLPAATAVATGSVTAAVAKVATSGGGVGPAVPALAVLSLVLVLDLVAASLLTPFRDWAAARVNGGIRETVRAAVGGPPGVAHLDDQVVVDAATLPVHDISLWNLGAGAEGQLWLLARFAGAAVSAVLLATVSVPAAIVELACVLLARAILRRQYAGALGGGMNEVQAALRGANYWLDVASGTAGAKELRLYGFQPWAIDEFAANHAVAPQRVARMLRRAMPRAWIVFLLSALAGGVPFLLVVRATLDGGVSTSQFAVALGAVVGLFTMGAMGFEAFSIESALARLATLRTLDQLQQEASFDRPAPVLAPRDTVPVVEFDDVWFRYPGGDRDVLRGLTLRLEPGRSVAVVGENGAGKTTLVKLLGGFYEPTRGRVLVDGVDLRELDAAAWRRNLAVIFQDFVHYELPVVDNVTLAALDHPDRLALARSAADAAGASAIIDALPYGWDTVLGRGIQQSAELSGGQWQRIALARALYAAKVGATVLLLDEPTASLDVRAEVELFDQLLDHTRGCTSLVVSHRFSTVRRAERIVVIDDGRVIEDGDHASLLARDGTYATLYRLQASRYADEPTEGGPA